MTTTETMHVEIAVTIPEGADVDAVGELLFDVLVNSALDDELVFSVDGFEVGP